MASSSSPITTVTAYKNVPLANLRPAERNPRTHSQGQIAQIVASIRMFGFTNPLLIDPDGRIIAGHGRYAAAQEAGMTEVPCIEIRGLTASQQRALVIADNQLALNAGWDEQLLAAELGELQADGFDLALTGFGTEELSRLLSLGGQEGLTDPDDVPSVQEEPITQPGDLWLLGTHRLICGDSTEPATVTRLMDGAAADLLLTDPPYGVAYQGKTEDRLTIANDDLDTVAYRRFLVASLGAAVGVLKLGGSFYVWHADSMGLDVRSACLDIGLRVRQCLVWAKSTMVLGRQDYQWKHEPCLYGWREGARHTWLSDRCQTTLLAFDKPSRSTDHPTMKPVALFAYQIGNSCTHGGIVIDPFGGSGTTIVAAEQTGRRGFVIELDPRYCDVIVKRWEAFTGKKATRVAGDYEPSDALAPVVEPLS